MAATASDAEPASAPATVTETERIEAPAAMLRPQADQRRRRRLQPDPCLADA